MGAKLGGVFGGFPVHDLAVVQRCLDQQVRVLLSGNVGVRAVRFHVLVVFFDIGVAPLQILADSQGQGVVQHGVQNIHERHLRQDGLEQIRAQVDDGPHQEAAGAAALNGKAARRRVLLPNQELGAGDKVCERVLLDVQLAGFAPVFAHFPAAPDMGHGKDHAPVKQAEAVR